LPAAAASEAEKKGSSGTLAIEMTIKRKCSKRETGAQNTVTILSVFCCFVHVFNEGNAERFELDFDVVRAVVNVVVVRAEARPARPTGTGDVGSALMFDGFESQHFAHHHSDVNVQTAQRVPRSVQLRIWQAERKRVQSAAQLLVGNPARARYDEADKVINHQSECSMMAQLLLRVEMEHARDSRNHEKREVNLKCTSVRLQRVENRPE
jgi:hypothetical protein